MSRRKLTLIITASVIVSGATVLIIYWAPISSFVHSFFTPMPQPGDMVEGEPILTEEQKLYNHVVEVALKDGQEAGQKILDDELAKTTDDVRRAELYSQKASIASLTPNNDDAALDYAYKSEELYPTYGTAIMIADLEYFTGDKSKALQYYRLYLERLTPEVIELNPGDKEAIEQRVQELEEDL